MRITDYETLLSKKLLKQAVEDAWKDDGLNRYCTALVAISMPRRMELRIIIINNKAK